jgi:hypothetical protein
VVAPRRRRGRGRGRATAAGLRQHQHDRRVGARRFHLPLLLRPRRSGPGLQAHEARDEARGGGIGRARRWRRRRSGRWRAREPAWGGGGAEGRGEQAAWGEEPALAGEAAVPVEEVEEHAAAAGERRRLLLHYGEAAAAAAAHPSASPAAKSAFPSPCQAQAVQARSGLRPLTDPCFDPGAEKWWCSWHATAAGSSSTSARAARTKVQGREATESSVGVSVATRSVR